jgi:uncharacterized lipoprotein YmbA
MPRTFAALLTGLCLLAGCGVSPPAKFYILTPVEEHATQSAGVPGPALGIGPVSFPPYLDRPEIVHRSGANQLHLAGSHRWGEPLKATFSRTLAENLAIMLPTERIARYPWPRSTGVDYQVSVDVSRFDADAGGTVVLAVSWEVSRPRDGTVLSRHKTAYRESAGGLDYAAIVAAQSRAVAQLSRAIAAAIRRSMQPAG